MRGVPRRAFVFDPPDRFVAGTVGEPGSRTFFLQAREGTRVVSVVLEKTQVAVLAERLGSLLLELPHRGGRGGGGGGRGGAPPGAPAPKKRGAAPRGALEAIEELEDDPDGPDLFRVR